MPLIPGNSRLSGSWTRVQKRLSELVNKNDRTLFSPDATFNCHGEDVWPAILRLTILPARWPEALVSLLPMASVVGAWQRTRLAVFMAHGFLWLVGHYRSGFWGQTTAKEDSRPRMRLKRPFVRAKVISGYWLRISQRWCIAVMRTAGWILWMIKWKN